VRTVAPANYGNGSVSLDISSKQTLGLGSVEENPGGGCNVRMGV
jgi:hypothetical protein